MYYDIVWSNNVTSSLKKEEPFTWEEFSIILIMFNVWCLMMMYCVWGVLCFCLNDDMILTSGQKNSLAMTMISTWLMMHDHVEKWGTTTSHLCPTSQEKEEEIKVNMRGHLAMLKLFYWWDKRIRPSGLSKIIIQHYLAFIIKVGNLAFCIFFHSLHFFAFVHTAKWKVEWTFLTQLHTICCALFASSWSNIQASTHKLT